MSRHSSLNELRDLVRLLKPQDIFPCVEDPLKLTYLDLTGCFGDLCDLTKGTYMKKIGAVLDVSAEIALQQILEERWAYDEISDEESENGNDDAESMVRLEQESHSRGLERSSILSEPPESDSRSSNITPITEHVGDGADATEDENTQDVDNQDVDDNTQDVDDNTQEHDEAEQQYDTAESWVYSQDSSVLYRDHNNTDGELVTLYFEMASRGESIALKSVQGRQEETVL